MSPFSRGVHTGQKTPFRSGAFHRRRPDAGVGAGPGTGFREDPHASLMGAGPAASSSGNIRVSSDNICLYHAPET
jgi:hypothetical protein